MSNEPSEDLVRAYSKSLLSGAPGAEEGTLESLVPGSDALEAHVESILDWMPDAGDRRDDIVEALDHLRTEATLDAKDLGALEAIIFPTKRPVSDIRNGRIVKLPKGEFRGLIENAETRRRVEKAVASVGCILVPNDARIPYAGTGFVVGQGLVMTNRHVARLFAEGLGRGRISFVPGQIAQFNPRREEANAKDDPKLQVTGVRMVHPYWDMALLEVEGLDLAPLRLASVDPSTGARRKVAVVGYPAFDPRNNTEVQNAVFRNRFFVKRLSPGYLTGRRSIPSFDNQVSAATHDASTLGGNSGSAVIDVASGDVVALHFAGLYLDTNFAVPIAELARDARVIDAGVDFVSPSPAASLPWEDHWRRTETESPATLTAGKLASTRQALAADGGSASVRVTIPIEVTVRVGQVVTAKAEDPTPSGLPR